jgi:hypothetical protein
VVSLDLYLGVLRMSRKSNLKLCDELWSKLVKIRAWFKCEYCWWPWVNSHHLFTRNNYATRFDLDNGVCLCKWHHTMSSKFSAHKTPMIFDEWIISKRWQERYDRLKLKANSVRDKDYDKVEKYLIEETNKLTA